MLLPLDYYRNVERYRGVTLHNRVLPKLERKEYFFGIISTYVDRARHPVCSCVDVSNLRMKKHKNDEFEENRRSNY